jgi:anti-sigma regulatory factor (Ser/Thr protein kinase)
MTNSPRPAAIRFDRLIQADPGGVADAREELSRWLLQEFDLDSVRFNDMVLAVYEALANAAEFAYLTAETAGSVTLAAEHDSASSALTLTVADQGRWRHVEDSERCRSRGRGLPLIKGLADRADIDTSERGTTVRMVFDGVVPVVAHNGAEVANF